MRLVHWSHKKVENVHSEWQRKKGVMGGFGAKPMGFWVSDEMRGAHGWRAWTRNERFRPYGFRYEHEVKLSDKAKILYLRSHKDIEKFTRRYASKNPNSANEMSRKMRLEKPLSSVTGRAWEPYVYDIDWYRVARNWHGIIITPYIWSQRLSNNMWYYGWDCASGCIWNARAIESITMVKERKVPKKPTIWQERRAHKRQMERMRESLRKLKLLHVRQGLIKAAANNTRYNKKEVVNV